MKPFSQHQLRDYSSLFSRTEAQAWLKCNFQSLNHKITRYDNDWLSRKKYTYKDYLKYVYNILEHNYPNEYIVKNSFLSEWLIPEIGQNNAIIFNEFRVGKAVADLAIFNGSSKVFEIKTEFDSDNRLELQLENYKKAFNEVFLIVPESKLAVYDKYDKSIGLISFNTKKQQKFFIERPSEVNYELNAVTIMEMLHSHEYKSIIENYYGWLPAMTSFNQFEKCSKLLLDIPIHMLNKLFIEYMKNRNMSNVFSSRYF